MWIIFMLIKLCALLTARVRKLFHLLFLRPLQNDCIWQSITWRERLEGEKVISWLLHHLILLWFCLCNKLSEQCYSEHTSMLMRGVLRDYMEKAMAPHSSTLAWKIPWTEEPGRLQSMGSLRVGHDWATSLSLFTFMHWRRKWQPTPVFLPGESQGWWSLVGCHLWGRTESDTTVAT